MDMLKINSDIKCFLESFRTKTEIFPETNLNDLIDNTNKSYDSYPNLKIEQININEETDYFPKDIMSKVKELLGKPNAEFLYLQRLYTDTKTLNRANKEKRLYKIDEYWVNIIPNERINEIKDYYKMLRDNNFSVPELIKEIKTDDNTYLIWNNVKGDNPITLLAESNDFIKDLAAYFYESKNCGIEHYDTNLDNFKYLKEKQTPKERFCLIDIEIGGSPERITDLVVSKLKKQLESYGYDNNLLDGVMTNDGGVGLSFVYPQLIENYFDGLLDKDQLFHKAEVLYDNTKDIYPNRNIDLLMLRLPLNKIKKFGDNTRWSVVFNEMFHTLTDYHNNGLYEKPSAFLKKVINSPLLTNFY